MTDVKICGIKTPEILSCVAKSGARFAGFVFVENSPRAIHPEQARLLARQLPTGLRSVGLFSNPDDETLSCVFASVPLDYIQLHGTESVARVQAIKSRFAVPVIKAIPIARAEDVATAESYQPVADWLLFDAKLPSSNMTGGNGIPFDWKILEGRKFTKPWMLSGGLTPENVEMALSILSPDAVDVSSGVESERGVKDTAKIMAFVDAVKKT